MINRTYRGASCNGSAVQIIYSQIVQNASHVSMGPSPAEVMQKIDTFWEKIVYNKLARLRI